MAIGKSRRVRFERFGVCERGGNPEKEKGLLAVESENCLVGESLKGSVGASILRRADGSSYGINATTLPADYYFSHCVNGEDKIGFVTKQGLLFLDDGEKPLSRCEFGGRVGYAKAYDSEHKEKLAFGGENGVWLYDETNGAVKTNAESASRIICYYKERVFCVKKPFTLLYSAPTNPSDFSESIDGGGRLEMPSARGEIVALLPLKEKLYIFFEYGICALEGAGSAKEFRVQEMAYHGSRIFGDSVGACFEKAFFLTETGLCVFDGKVVKNACENLAIKPKITDQVCAQAQADGNYYLRYVNEKGVETGLVVDGMTEKGNRCFAMQGLSVCKGEAVCYANGGLCKIQKGERAPAPFTSYFTAKNITFASAGVKTLNSLRVFGFGNAYVDVCAGRRTRRAKIAMESGVAQAYIGVRGKEFSIKIELEKGAEITALEAEVVQ